MIALIDADILVYESAYRCQESFEWEPGEWTEHASLPEAQVDFDRSLQFIMDETNSDTMFLALTDSDRDSNFRRSCWPEYKEHRGKAGAKRPLLYKALRQWIRDSYPVKEKPGIEADDAIGIMGTMTDLLNTGPDERVMCSVDKDLDTIPGLHFNWRKPDNKIYKVDDDLAFFNHMFQTITGDSTDNYPGIKGCGPVGAMKILEGTRGADKCATWHKVVEAFEAKGFDEAFALSQARCAFILHASHWDFDNEKVFLWAPPGEQV